MEPDQGLGKSVNLTLIALSLIDTILALIMLLVLVGLLWFEYHFMWFCFPEADLHGKSMHVCGYCLMGCFAAASLLRIVLFLQTGKVE